MGPYRTKYTHSQEAATYKRPESHIHQANESPRARSSQPRKEGNETTKNKLDRNEGLINYEHSHQRALCSNQPNPLNTHNTPNACNTPNTCNTRSTRNKPIQRERRLPARPHDHPPSDSPTASMRTVAPARVNDPRATESAHMRARAKPEKLACAASRRTVERTRPCPGVEGRRH